MCPKVCTSHTSLWQCLQCKSFSIKKKKIKAPSVIKKIFSDCIFSKASGKRCKNAPPIKAPAEKETKNKVIFDIISFFKSKINTATHTQTVIENVANIICSKTILYFLNNNHCNIYKIKRDKCAPLPPFKYLLFTNKHKYKKQNCCKNSNPNISHQ